MGSVLELTFIFVENPSDEQAGTVRTCTWCLSSWRLTCTTSSRRGTYSRRSTDSTSCTSSSRYTSTSCTSYSRYTSTSWTSSSRYRSLLCTVPALQGIAVHHVPALQGIQVHHIPALQGIAVHHVPVCFATVWEVCWWNVIPSYKCAGYINFQG